jgi:hypothetical protein
VKIALSMAFPEMDPGNAISPFCGCQPRPDAG